MATHACNGHAEEDRIQCRGAEHPLHLQAELGNYEAKNPANILDFSDEFERLSQFEPGGLLTLG